MTSNDVLDSMLRFAEEAAALALDARAQGLAPTYKGEGFAQAFTEADGRISTMMHARFAPRLVEEESAEAIAYADARRMVAEAHDWTFIGDPIDGTAPFAGGLAGWGTMIAACRAGWPQVGVLMLPAYGEARDAPMGQTSDARGVLLAACDGSALWAPTLNGRMQHAPRALAPSRRATGHVGWTPVAAKYYTIDYASGCFPVGESGVIADAAALALGRLDAMAFCAKLWDLAPILPILQALGHRLFRWPDLAAPPANVCDLFRDDYACEPDLWLICRSQAYAETFSRAIGRACSTAA